jgi:hypothetical protein
VIERRFAALLVAALVVALLPREARAQEFAVPEPGLSRGGAAGPAALLERALPDAGSCGAAALVTSWPLDLSARSLLIGGSWRGLAAATGVTRAGNADLGWSGAGLALGYADREAGAGVRTLVRRDDAADDLEPRAGIEVGAGGWLRVGFSRVWASAPQAWLDGVSPPLARGLTLGLELEGPGVLLALEREAPRRGLAEAAGHTARLALTWSGASAWLEARDDPWRGGLGIRASAGALRVAAQVDSHPVLAPTVRLSAGFEWRAPGS